ncbi:MAG: hypothetical protein GWO10_03215, partial [candidate division Zixibacteria bacterium]|nr:hypothetical protein [candidate division Zixibacteria bacterium]
MCIFIMIGTAFALGTEQDPSHMDMMKNPDGCAACHGGRGISGTPLLKEKVNTLCFNCHGERGGGRARTDVESVFQKRYVHPVLETGMRHRKNEVLPELNVSEPRHVSCLDCHSAHIVSEGQPFRGAKGYRPGDPRGGGSGIPPRRAESVFELCYLCHSDSANLPSGSSDIAADFSTSNPSFHPVEATGRNLSVPSLRAPLTETDMITCLSCHGNDEPWGSRGPHGSN